MEKAYGRINWENYPSVVTPLNEKNLNKMDSALNEVDNRVLGLDTAKLDKSTANKMVCDVDLEEETGTFVITLLDGTVKKLNTKLEKIAVERKYNPETEQFVFVLDDGTEQKVDISKLITVYEFLDTDTIAFSINSDGEVSAIVKDGSITEAKLQPNFLADVKTEVAKAKSHSDSAYSSASTANDLANQAKQYRDEAEQFRNEAFSGTPDGYTELQETVASNTVKIDTIIEKAELNIKNNASGENLHLTDSADSKAVSFNLYGKAEQKQYSGKNLIPYPYDYKTTTSNGISWTDLGDGRVMANGTATADSPFNCQNRADTVTPFILPVGTYILTGCPSGGSGSTYRNLAGRTNPTTGAHESFGTDTGNGVTFTITEESTTTQIQLMVKSGTTVNNLIFEPMLRRADITDATWEPYVGGMPSPNPDYPQDIEVSGESYNLLPYPYYETTHEEDGIVWTDVGDGTVKANGTATEFSELLLRGRTETVIPLILKAGTYILSGCPSGGSASTYRIHVGRTSASNTWELIGNDTGSGFAFTLDKDTQVGVSCVMASGTTANNLTFYPMIRKASVKNDRYMPYGVGSVEVKSVGKNVIDQICVPILDSQAKTHFLKAGVYTITRDSVESGKIWFFGAFDGSGSVITESAIQAQSCSLNGSKEYYYGAQNLDAVKITLNVDCYFKVGVLDGLGTTYFMMSKGDKYEPYEPYTETVSTIPTDGLAGIKVSSGGNYTDENGQQWICDEIVKYADGSGKRIQRIGKHTFSGSESIVKSGITSVDRYLIFLPEDSNKILSDLNNDYTICTIGVSGKMVSNTKVGYCGIDRNSTKARLAYNYAIYGSSTIEDFKTDITGAEIYYVLAEPIITDLTAEEIAEIEKLYTFYPVTNISNDADCGMSITYMADAKNYIDNRLALIEKAMINNI